MAAGILQECNLKHPVEILARGLVVLFPEPLNQKAEAVMISNGINMDGFMSTQLTEEDFSEDALVLVMEHSQREKILEKYGHADPENVYVSYGTGRETNLRSSIPTGERFRRTDSAMRRCARRS